MLRSPLLGTLTLWGASLLSPAPCAAYCRTTTEVPDASVAPDTCYTEGYPLFWPTRHLRYAINERGVPGFADDELREALDTSFGAWTDVVCAGQRLDLWIEQIEEPTKLKPRPKGEEPRVSVISYVREADWTDETHALAITNMRYSRNTGHILGGDLLLNGAHEFGICPDTGCDGDVTDLLNVVTHEAGHFLGLAHSDVEGSSMWWNAAAWDTDKRTLEADDVQGLCAIYGPNAVLGPPEGGREPDGRLLCSLAVWRRPGEGTGWLALGLALWLARRRRR
jgi:hypothetical protein